MAKVVLITGGSSGLGKATGMYLKQKGYQVYGTTRDLEGHKNFNHFQLLELDVREENSIAHAVAQVIEKEGKIDVLVNNAGMGVTGAVEETPIDAAKNVFDVNFYGPLRMVQAVLPYMRQQGSGLVINITSIAGYMGLPFRGYYSASKGALELLTETLRIETKAFGVHFTCLAPGDFATNIASGRYNVPYTADSPYAHTYKKSLDLMDQHVDSGGNPEQVAQKIYRIIRTKNPKVHYRVGAFLQRFSVFLKKTLPDTIYEKLLLQHYKL